MSSSADPLPRFTALSIFLTLVLAVPASSQELPLNAVFVRASQPAKAGRLAVHWTGDPAATLSVWLETGDDEDWRDREPVVHEALLAESLALFDVEIPERSASHQAGDTLASGIAKWDGSSWSALGAGLVGEVAALATWDDGMGPLLHAAGTFSLGGGATLSQVAKWDGATPHPCPRCFR